jgi:hypothetical protein
VVLQHLQLQSRPYGRGGSGLDAERPRGRGGPNQDVCYRCHQTGHIARNCQAAEPVKRAPKRGLSEATLALVATTMAAIAQESNEQTVPTIEPDTGADPSSSRPGIFNGAQQSY